MTETIAVTGATGQLGRLVIDHLRRVAPGAHVVAIARNAAAAADLPVEIRSADYTRPETLAAAFAGVDKLLLISSSEVGQRAPQHRNVIDAAKAAGVRLLAYTSILHADSNPMGLAVEHRDTEAAIRASGLPFVFLRNGWYTENYTGSTGAALAHGAVIGSAGTGLISSAARADFAEAAARVLASAEDQAGRIYELAGDSAYTLADLAAEIGRQAGKPVVYRDLPEADYRAALLGFGLPEGLAAALAESDVKAASGALFEDGGQLSRLIGRPTTPLARTVAAALAA
ncbi:SDR family oxidoreductase [Zavarzinia compransoris]|uniref:SDR family oxidoreductase n=1 Tax=Zavarzinia marina TaxID=2911065 RepID=UPI001F26E360|nr:SDR family oxidoreductase [Zavarzinia marina]MCF4164060.1 SDR family oxidoreductase [Zavarzinia marina]